MFSDNLKRIRFFPKSCRPRSSASAELCGLTALGRDRPRAGRGRVARRLSKHLPVRAPDITTRYATEGDVPDARIRCWLC
jgi:hypothetical protein